MDEDIEQEIQEKGLTGPRITKDDIEGLIVGEVYFTAEEGAAGAASARTEAEHFTHPRLSLLTFCVLVLKNGFTVTGESAVASPENFDSGIWRKIARRNAFDKVWQLEGYALCNRLNADATKVSS